MMRTLTVVFVLVGGLLPLSVVAQPPAGEEPETPPPLPLAEEGSDTAGAEAEGEAPQLDATMEAAQGSLDDEAARQLFMAGRALYQSGRFSEAADQWQRAYDLSGRSELLYNVYVARRDAGEVELAANALRQYLDEVEDVPDRVALEARLSGLESQLASQRAQAEATREAEAEAARARAEAEAAAARQEEGGRSPIPWIVAGVGGALVVAGAITGGLALGAVSELEDNCPNDQCPTTYTEFDDDLDEAETLVTVTDLLLFSGGILAAAGLTWGILDLILDSDEESEDVAVGFGCLPGQCFAQARVAFGGGAL